MHLGREDTEQPLWSPAIKFLITKTTFGRRHSGTRSCDKAKTFIASMYFDINRQIEGDLNKIEAIIYHAKGAGILLAIDSNSRSMSWHDTQINVRGRILEELLLSKHLNIINEESTLTTFLNSRGSSNIDLTVISNQLLRAVVH